MIIARTHGFSQSRSERALQGDALDKRDPFEDNALMYQDHRSSDILWEHAYHEGGHYVAVRVLHGRYPDDFPVKEIQEVSILQKGEAGGRVRFRLDDGWGMEPLIIQLLAGSVAQAMHIYLVNRGDLATGITDFQTAQDTIIDSARITLESCGGKRDREQIEALSDQPWQDLLPRTLEILHRYWCGVYAISEALRDRGELAVEEAIAIF